ncbi:MAG: hypothetical protein EOO73_31325 [Myxococcales bacterium]|nr:MAG: hypothetical protein EOO73_31325 [Myxococcales bacterium]
MSAKRYGKVLGALFVAGTVSIACGSVNEGRINIVDEDGGADGNGGTSGTGGKSNGGSSGKSPGIGGDVGEAGEGTVPVLPEPPVVVAISPDTGESEVEPTGTIRIEFSEGLDPATVTSDSIIIYSGETPVSGALDYSGVTAEFTPDERLDLLGEYDVVVTTSITDASGTAMEEDFSSSFTVRDGVWSEQVQVDGTAGELYGTLVSPVIDGAGNALIVWAEYKDAETFNSVFGRYFSPGVGFGEPFEIDEANVDCNQVSVATNAAGEAVVAWTEKHGTTDQVWVRRLSLGELGSAPVRIDSVAVTQVWQTTSAVSATGEAHVLWSYNDPGVTKQNLLANHVAPGGDWLTTPDVVYNYVETLSPPGVAFDEDGNGFVFFAFDSDGTDETPNQLYARRYLTASAQWGNGIAVEGSDGIDGYHAPSVVTDAKGGARAVFAAGKDVKAVTFSKGGGFSVAKVLDTLETSPQSLPQLSSNGRQFLASWYQSASLNTNAYSALSEGADFAAPELRSSGDFRVGYYGTAVSGMDRQGNALVLFEQGNATDTVDIVFSRLVGINGEWAEGSVVNSAAGEYQDPRIAVAPNGVAVAAWSLGIRLSANAIYVSTFE